MKIETTKKFDKDYAKLPKKTQKTTGEKLKLFLENPKHPSLRVKKIKGYPNLWEGSINMNYRFVFFMEDELCILYRLGTHDILNNPL